MPKPLSEHQRRALIASEKGEVRWGGRGSKQTMKGLATRGLIEGVGYTFFGWADFCGKLTDEGKRVAEELRRG